MNTQVLDRVAFDSSIAEQQKLRVSDKYITMDTSAMVRTVIDKLGVPATIRVFGNKRIKSTKHTVEIRLQTPLMLVGSECYPTVLITNSYAGESSLQVTVGFHRLVCSNGMVAGVVHFRERINHVGAKNSDKFTHLADTIKRAIEFSCSRLEEIAARANAATATEAELQDLLGAVMASPTLAKRVKEATRYARPEDRTGPNGTLTMWNLWNIVNEQMRKGGRSEVRLLERNVKLANAVDSVIKLAA